MWEKEKSDFAWEQEEKQQKTREQMLKEQQDFDRRMNENLRNSSQPNLYPSDSIDNEKEWMYWLNYKDPISPADKDWKMATIAHPRGYNPTSTTPY